VGLREVAKKAGVSLGNIYNHYTGKEPLFTSLITRLYLAFAGEAAVFVARLDPAQFPGDLEKLGHAIGELVTRHRDYLTLVYVDIAEFDGRNARPHYDDLAGKFSALFNEKLARAGLIASGIDPGVAFTTVYLLFTNYFIIQRVIGASPLGLKEGDSVAALAKILSSGLKLKGGR
jgi:AcrR family transcriptional regulator